MDAAIQHPDSSNIRHLKRFIKPEDCPCFKSCPKQDKRTERKSDIDEYRKVHDVTLHGYAVQGGLSQHDNIRHVRNPSQAAILHFLVCAASSISYNDLQTILSSTASSLAGCLDAKLRIVSVPRFPPVSEDHAKQISRQSWPTAYKGGNPFGPHPTIVSRATQEIQDQVRDWMLLAERAGSATWMAHQGELFGAVVVNRTRAKDAVILAAAGDARWKGVAEELRQGPGNPLAHPVMRVIGMIARKRRSLLSDYHPKASVGKDDYYAEQPLTPLERDFYDKSTIAAGGYLCLNFELYLTHEPCIMCCMAINHSRFGRVIFGEAMVTGGLSTEKKGCADTDMVRNAYGLWWRQELNWKFLTWHWIGDGSSRRALRAQRLHA